MKYTPMTIISRHDSLTEAILESGIDISYNEAETLRQAKVTDKGYGYRPGQGAAKCHGAYVVESDKGVRGIYSLIHVYDQRKQRDPLILLNQWNQYSSCIHSGAFHRAQIGEKEITFEGQGLSRSMKARQIIADLGWVVTTEPTLI